VKSLPLAGLIVLASCSTSIPHPTIKNPLAGCHITCPQGFSFRRQHLCRGDKRYFQDVRIKEEYTQRGADGELLKDLWVTDVGDVPKEDVVLGSCTGAEILLRKSDGRAIGLYPGESPPQEPTAAPPRR
jgi:hypothetical protein